MGINFGEINRCDLRTVPDQVGELHLSADQGIRAATMGGAHALARTDIAVLSHGMKADFIVLSASSVDFLAYRPGVPQIAHTYLAGKALTT